MFYFDGSRLSIMHAHRYLIPALIINPLHAAVTVAHWNFNSLSITTAAQPGSPSIPNSITASHGNGTIDLSTWNGNVDDFAGTSLNTLNNDPAGTSLSLIAGNGSPYPGNGGSILIHLSLTNLQDPVLSFATQSTSTGFINNQLSWSTDGSDFTPFGTPYTPDPTYNLVSFDLSSINPLDNSNDAWLRLSFNGATGATGNNRIDNLTITAIPEPSALLLLGGAGMLLLRRRRRKTATVIDRRYIQP